MIKNLVVLLSVLGFHFHSFAESVNSEFFFQPAPGASTLSGTFSYLSSTVEIAPLEVKTTGFILIPEYLRGLNESVAVGIGGSYWNLKTESFGSETATTGLGDIEFIIRGRHPNPFGSLRYGAEMDVSLGDAEKEANGDQNAMSGGIMLTPYVGFQLQNASGFWGVKLSREVEVQKRTEIDNGTKEVHSGGEDIDLIAFVERELAPERSLGLSVEYSKSEDSQTDTGGTVTTTTARDAVINFDLYMPIRTTNGTLIPHFLYGISTDEVYDTYAAIAVQLTYRMDF